jgi:Xaa-Pro aminopeptidase
MVNNEFEERRVVVSGGLAARKLDALLVSFGPNLRYLSGFTGSNGSLLVLPDKAILFTDPRYHPGRTGGLLSGADLGRPAFARRRCRDQAPRTEANRLRTGAHEVRFFRVAEIAPADEGIARSRGGLG